MAGTLHYPESIRITIYCLVTKLRTIFFFSKLVVVDAATNCDRFSRCKKKNVYLCKVTLTVFT